MKTSSIIAGSSLALSITLLLVALATSVGAFGGKGMGYGIPAEDRAGMQALHENTTREVENIENGVVMTITADDPDTVAKIQSMKPKGPRNDEVTQTRENIESGVRVTITSDDPDMVERIQNNPMHESNPGTGFGCHNRGKGFSSAEDRAEMQAVHENTTREVENIENGVVMTITADDPDTVAKIQSMEPKGPRNDEVTQTRENIENGVRVTITSDDPDMVERIQARSENPAGDEGFGQHRGMGRGHGMHR